MSKRTTLIATAMVLAVNSLTVIVPFVSPAKVSALSAAVVNTEAELRGALTGSDDVISLGDNITTTSQLSVTRPITIEGNNKTLTANFTGSSNNDTVLMASKPVTISNLTVDGAGKTGVQGVQIYRTTATLNNVTIKNNKKAGLNVNGSDVTVLNISTANNGGSFGGIHISKGSGVTETPKLTVNGRSIHTGEGLQIYKDPANSNNGIVVDTNEQYTSTNLFGYVTYKLKPAPAVPANLRLNGSETCGFITSTNWITPTWDKVSGAASYNYKVNLPGGGTYGPANVGDVASVSGAFGGAGVSAFSVQAVSKSGLTSDWAPMCEVTYAPKPSAPILTTPAKSAVIPTDQFWFEWNPVSGAVSYEFQTSQSSATNPDGSLSTGVWSGDSNHNQPTEPRAWSAGASGTWYWQVRAVSTYGVKSDWSEVWAVTIDKTVPQLTVDAPADLVTYGDALIVTGSVFDENINEYKYQILDSNKQNTLGANGWSRLGGTSNVTGDLFTADISGLADGVYYISVWANDKAGNATNIAGNRLAAPYIMKFTVDRALVASINSIATNTTTPVISGAIVRNADGSPLANVGVVVTVGTEEIAAMTDTNGRWSIRPVVGAGLHTVSVALAGANSAGLPLVSTSFTTTLAPVSVPNIPNVADTPATQAVSVIVPSAVNPSTFAQVLGDTTDVPSGSQIEKGDVKGAETVAQAANATDANTAKTLGMAWYWWFLIIAGVLLTLWWIIAAARRRRAEA